MELTPAFVLHARPYRETSALVQLFTLNDGRVSVVAKGGRSKRSPWRSILQPFVPLLIRYRGNSGLKSLLHAEPSGLAFPLFNDYLYSSLYLNELLYYILVEGDSQPELFDLYQQTLLNLADPQLAIPVVLRCFEFKFLTLMGYGIEPPPGVDMATCYHYRLDEGFISTSGYVTLENCYSGAEILMLCQFNPLSDDHLRLAKRFCRQVIGMLLGGRTLKSRELFLNIKSTE